MLNCFSTHSSVKNRQTQLLGYKLGRNNPAFGLKLTQLLGLYLTQLCVKTTQHILSVTSTMLIKTFKFFYFHCYRNLFKTISWQSVHILQGGFVLIRRPHFCTICFCPSDDRVRDGVKGNRMFLYNS